MKPILPQRTETFEAFVAPARHRPALWRLLLGSLLAIFVWAGAIAAALALTGAAPGLNAARLIAFLISFIGLILGLWAAVRLLHDRAFATLIGPHGFRARHFAAGACIVLLLTALIAAAGAMIWPPVQQMPLHSWLLLLPLALPAILVQSAAEELAFRGYLMQGLAARFRSRILWWVLPAALFGAVHWNPVEFGPNAPLVVLSAALMGLILGDVTARIGNLSAAIGLHFANNTVALLVVAPRSEFDRLSLFLDGLDTSDVGVMRLALLLNIAVMLVIYVLWLVWWNCGRRLHSHGPGFN